MKKLNLFKKDSANNASITKPKRNLSFTIIVAVIMAIAIGAVYMGLSNVLESESYYVLNTDVPAKVQVRVSMLKEVVTAKGTSPQNAISLAEVKQGTVYTKYPLVAGDILSQSNTGINIDTTVGIPEDWTTTSFSINADNAVGGNITRGDYFDIIGIDAENGSQYLFFNVLALEVSVVSSGAPGEEATTGVPMGATMQYIVGMPADDVLKFHHEIAHYPQLKMVLAPNSLKYKVRDVSHLDKIFIMTGDTRPSDLFEGTDNTFTPILRDEFGRPVNYETCAAGIISPIELCEQLPELPDNLRYEVVEDENPVENNIENNDFNNDENIQPTENENTNEE